jgi:murein DD-endopeptidase MepM/ murein hydrolase activator NlpD
LKRRRHLSLGLAAAAAVALASAPLLRALDFQVFAPPEAPFTLVFRSLDPGEAILARLKDDCRFVRVVLNLGGQVRVLAPAKGGAPGSAAALLGIDLGTKPQPLALRVKAERPDGTFASFEWPLVVTAKEFPKTQLKVAPDMTNPPAALLETIRRESEMVAEVLSRVSPGWLAEGAFQSPLPAYQPFPNFGQQRIYNQAASSVHSGVDIAAPRGTSAAAPNAGRIVLANKLYYSGWTVIIDHGRGVFTYCCHFDRVLVKRGDLVRKGQAIAEVGSTGRSTGPHLHWSVRILSARVDPFSLVALPL